MFRKNTDETILSAQQNLGDVIDSNWNNPNCREKILSNLQDGFNTLNSYWEGDTSRVIIVNDVNIELLKGSHIWKSYEKNFYRCGKGIPANQKVKLPETAKKFLQKVCSRTKNHFQIH